MKYWYRISHLFIKYLAWIVAIVHISTYSSAIVLAVSGQPVIAAVVGSVGIALSRWLSRQQVSMQARRMAFESIESREQQKERDRQRNPFI